MKLVSAKLRRSSGILLIECLVYIVVFAILTSIGMAAFYLCWNQSKAVVYATDDIGAVLRSGERWRADIRNATGPVTVEQATNGEKLQIPLRDKTIVYRFESGEVRREMPATQQSELFAFKANSSQMNKESREGVTAWRWELNVSVRRPETQLPLLFTFEAVPSR